MTTESPTAHRTPHTAGDSAEPADAAMRAPARARTESSAAHTLRHVLWQGWRTEFVPPTVWTDRPASLREMCLYAHHGPWAAEQGTARRFGIAYFWAWAMPHCVAARTWDWIAQRPSRTAAAAAIYTAVAHTTVGRAVLPWPTWLP